MSIRAMVVVLLALVCGLAAAAGVHQLRHPAAADGTPRTTPVILAALDIARDHVIEADDVRVADWPKGLVPEGCLHKLEDVIGRSTLMPMLKGETVLEAKVAAGKSGRGLAALVPKGMRAYTIMTSRVASGVAGFVLPGNRVDILLNLRTCQNDDAGGGSTNTLLQSVEVLAVNQLLDSPNDNKVNPKDLTCVTLLVTPEQATLLDLGQNMGQLTLSLRNPEDGGTASTTPATLADIRFHHEKPAGLTDVVKVLEKAAGKATEKSEPEMYQILTLRGNLRGRVTVTKDQ